MYPAPFLKSDYIRIYKPGPDAFPGPGSGCFEEGGLYQDWVPNDHCILKGHDGCWHSFGITHPAPPDEVWVHEGEWLSFHAVSPQGNLKDHLYEGAWKDHPKILPPAERPGEIVENHAPFVVRRDDLYHMFYGPDPIRLAVSRDLYHWEPKGPVFHQEEGARDPNIMLWGDRYLMCYCSRQSVLARLSTDLIHWGEPTEIFRMRTEGDPESPLVLERHGLFYLFWCVWDYNESEPYNDNTYVYCSPNPLEFHAAPQVAHLRAHAPEVFRDESGEWFLSSAEKPRRGVSIAPLGWRESSPAGV